MLSQEHAEEATIVFEGGCPPRAGRARRVPLGSRKIESIAVRFPVSRAKVKTCKKENFTSCGEASTYQGTFSGVSFRACSELPLISPSEKAKVLARSEVLQAREVLLRCGGRLISIQR